MSDRIKSLACRSTCSVDLLVVWSKISNAWKRLGFRCFLLQLVSETSRACTIRVRRSSLGRPWNAWDAPARLCHRNSESRTAVAKRISDGGEPDPARSDQGSVTAFGRRKGDTGRSDRRCLGKFRSSSIRPDGGQHFPSPRHFSSAEAKANDLLEELYPLTPGRFGGHGLLHDGSPDAQGVDDLLCAVLHPLGDSPSESGRIHAVPGSGVDGAAGTKHHDGGVGMPERLPLSAARPRYEVLPIISGTDPDGKRESASIAGKKPESELVRGTLGEVGQRRVSVEADPVWRIVAAASVATIYRTLPRGAQPSGQRQSDLVSFAAGGTDEHGSSAVSRTTGGPAEVLREGSGIRVDGTDGGGLTISNIY